MGELITFKEAWKRVGGLVPELFVSSPSPCERFYLPVPIVPVCLLDVDKALVAQEALSRCTAVVGTWGDRISRVETPDFREPAQRFKHATGGVDAWEVINLARQRMLRLPHGY